MQSATIRSFTRSVCWILMSGTLALTLGGCSHPPKRVSEPDIMATAEGVRYEMRYFYGQDGVRLFRQAWIPDSKAKGVLVVVHGLKDHSGRYADLGQTLAKQGFAVFAADLRGHGHSGGTPQMADNFNDYLVDLALMVRQARTQFPDTPVFLLGQDMGGLIATRFVEMIPNAVQGLAVSSATLALQESKYKLWGLKVVAAIAPSAALKQIDVKAYSHDPDVAQELANDPLVSQSGIPAKTLQQEVNAIQTLNEQTERLTLPILVMHGVADTINPLFGSIAFYDAVPSEQKTLKQYPDLAHDLWHETGNEAVIADLTEWLNGLVKH
ncbi:MAG TPA: alpha/beta hydrolase [Aquabacterium sp.]|nr:alpha/beta hydrolase [Aquabacterium sp.]